MHDDERATVVRLSRRLVLDGLCVGTAGNVSVRVAEGVLITPSGLDPERLTPDDVCFVDADGRVVETSREPSSELAMHLAVYRVSDAAAVVHTHSPFATALSTTHAELPAIHYSIAPLGGTIRVAPYALFGTDALAANLASALGDRSGAILQNHGTVTIGRTAPEAYDRAVLLEWLCALYWRALQAGNPRILTEGELAEATAQFRTLRYGEG